MTKKLEITAQIDPDLKKLNSDLIYAVFENNASKLKDLLVAGASPNSGDAVMTATERAVKSERYGIARLLIDAGVKVDVKNGPNSKLLHECIKNGGFDFARFLIVSGASVNAFNEIHQAPLFLCAENYLSTDAIEIASIAELLISKGARVNALDKHKFTPLIQAAHQGATEICRILINSGASVDMKEKDGNSALHWAARRGHQSVCKDLIESGSILDSTNCYGVTPFIAAAQGNHCGVMELLEASGANPFHTTHQGKSALHLSASIGLKEASLLLLSISSKIFHSSSLEYFLDLSDHIGRTPLSMAAQNGCVAVCRILLDEGANPNSVDRENSTPLHAAAGSSIGVVGADHAGVCRLLIDRGALTENKNSNGQTPLHVAAITGTEKSVAALISHGADFTAKGGLAGTMSVTGFAGKHKRQEMVQHIKSLIQCKQAEQAIEEVMLMKSIQP